MDYGIHEDEINFKNLINEIEILEKLQEDNEGNLNHIKKENNNLKQEINSLKLKENDILILSEKISSLDTKINYIEMRLEKRKEKRNNLGKILKFLKNFIQKIIMIGLQYINHMQNKLINIF